MVKTLNLHAEIPADRELRVTLPDDIPTGPAKVVIVVATADDRVNAPTLQELADSAFFGMWASRTDLDEDFPRRLRVESWKRSA